MAKEKKIVAAEEQSSSKKRSPLLATKYVYDADGNVKETISVNEKTTYFEFDLYPDCDLHRTFIETANDGSPFGFQMVYILHDRDRWTEDEIGEKGDNGGVRKVGDLKKPHWHVMVKLPYPMLLKTFQDAMQRWIGNVNGIEPVRSVLGYSMYLTHSDPKSRLLGKYQYAETDIRGDLRVLQKTDVKTLFGFAEILNEWVEQGYDATYMSAILFIAHKGYDDFVRKTGYVATRLIDEACRRKAAKFDAIFRENNCCDAYLYNRAAGKEKR